MIWFLNDPSMSSGKMDFKIARLEAGRPLSVEAIAVAQTSHDGGLPRNRGRGVVIGQFWALF